jgi:hypothetical protein
VGKFCHGGWSWNETDHCLDVLVACLALQRVSSDMVAKVMNEADCLDVLMASLA